VSVDFSDLQKKISQRQLRSVAMELIPFWRFKPARVDPNYASKRPTSAGWPVPLTASAFIGGSFFSRRKKHLWHQSCAVGDWSRSMCTWDVLTFLRWSVLFAMLSQNVRVQRRRRRHLKTVSSLFTVITSCFYYYYPVHRIIIV